MFAPSAVPGVGSRFEALSQKGLAVAAGLSVASIYYAQPLLDAIARDFGTSPAAIGLVVTLTQVVYALGLIFIVPLGDILDHRRLVTDQGHLSIAALVAVASAKTQGVLFTGLAAMGILAVVVQVLVAFAATLATPAERGRAVGTVTSGVTEGQAELRPRRPRI